PLRIAGRGTGGEDGQSRAAASAATPGTTGPALRTTWPRLLVHARWWVLSAWAVVGALAVVRAGGVADRLDVRGGSLRVTEASRVDELLATRFRQDIGETFLVLVTGPESFTGGRPRRLLDALCSALAREPYVREVTWFGSSGDSTLLSSERRLLPVAAVILFIACGSAAGAALPLAVGFLAIAVALAIVDVIAGMVPMSIYVLNVATMIGLGVGIDYSLLLLRRFREELERDAAVEDAVVRTVATAGATVGTSGL